jgi:predicted KAP-like P-loop ATPase
MSSRETISLSPQAPMIISDDTDDVSRQPILDFDAYSNTIVKMIKESHPKFSIGIYGEWGSGKTTLMKVIEQKLNPKKNDNNEDILTVWFNAWRYEREEQFALVSLLKTIAYKIDEQRKYDKVKKILFKSIITASKGLASKYIFSDKYVDEFEKNFTSQTKAFAEADKNTIYFQGMKQIEDIMKKNSRIFSKE